MSDDQGQDPEKKERPRLMNPTTLNLILATAVVILLLTITAYAGSVRTSAARVNTLRADIAALATSFKYPLLEANSIRTSAGRDRLVPMLTEIATSGNYEAVTLFDDKGEVIASTRTNQTRHSELEPKPWVGVQTGHLHASAPIQVGTSTIGYLYVETRF